MYTTEIGKKAAVRQITPYMHIDGTQSFACQSSRIVGDLSFAKEVAPFLPRTCVVGSGAVSAFDDNSAMIHIAKIADILT